MKILLLFLNVLLVQAQFDLYYVDKCDGRCYDKVTQVGIINEDTVSLLQETVRDNVIASIKSDTTIQGLKGQKGEMGLKGDAGEKGRRGVKGITGSCECKNAEFLALKQEVNDLKKLRAEVNELRAIVTSKPAQDGGIALTSLSSTLTAPPEDCKLEELGLKDSNVISDKQITASSYYDVTSFPFYGRLNFKHFGSTWGGWRIGFPYTTEEWIQVDMGKVKTVAGIITQGDGEFTDQSYYIKSYRVSHSISGINFVFIQQDGLDKVFEGNFDGFTKVQRLFSEPVQARYIRINPRSWHVGPILRFEIVTCQT